MKKILLFISLFLTTFLFGQNLNTYKFIEPNISINYDSSLFSIGTRYSNSVYEKESYDFKVKNNPNKIRILVKADIPAMNNFGMTDLQKSMTSKIKDIENSNIERADIISYDKEVKKVGDFLCLGFAGYIKPIKTYTTTIVCNHISDNDLTEIDFSFPYSKDLDSCYKIVAEFVTGFKFYSKSQVNYEDSIIKTAYHVSVVETKDTLEEFKWRKTTFLGIVKTTEPLKHTIKEVRMEITYGEEMFEALPNGQVPISCNDSEKGEIKKQGKLVVLNSFGKMVKIPFEFVYILK